MRWEDIQVFRVVQKNAELAMKAVDTVSDKTYDDDLALHLSRQSLKYSELRNQAAGKLLSAHLEPSRKNVVEEMVVAGTMHRDTLLNTSTSHIAELMIQGSNRGLTSMWKAINHHENAGNTSMEVAKELMDFEEKNIERLKKYL